MASRNELEEWRSFFAKAKSNIFDVISKAIAIAAADHPSQFRHRRDKIVELIHTCQLAGCDRVARAEENYGDNRGRTRIEDDDDDMMACTTGSMANGSQRPDNGSPDEPMVAVDDEVDEFIDIVGDPPDHLLLIKNVLIDYEHQSEDELVKSLTHLASMKLSVQDLERTLIGMTLKPLKKHESERVRSLAQKIYKNWRRLVVNETHIQSEDNKSKQATVTSNAKSCHITPAKPATQRNSDGQVEKPEKISGIGSKMKIKIKQKKPELKPNELHRSQQKDKLKELNSLDEKGINKKIELSKRKLKEGYQEVFEAKKQRTMQVMELTDLPDQKRGGKNSAPKPAQTKLKRRR